MWAVLTRLEQPKHANLTLLQKLKLYNGKTLPGFTEDNVIELKREAANEGMHRHQPAVHPGQDLATPSSPTRTRTTSTRSWCMHELEAGLRHHSLITDEEQFQHYRELLAVVKEEYEDIVKNEVQRAIAAEAIRN